MINPQKKHINYLPHISSILFTIGLIIVPNFLFWGISLKFHVARPIFNLDYFIAGALFATRFKPIAYLFFATALSFDFLAIGGLIFPFVRIQDINYLLSMLPYAALIWQLSAVVILFTIIGFVYLFFKFSHKIKPVVALAALLLSFTVYQAYALQPSFREADAFYSTSNKIIDSQGYFFISTHLISFIDNFYAPADPLFQVGFKGQTHNWVETSPNSLNKKLLLIIAESWGVMKDSQIQKAMIAPLLNQSNQFDWLEQGTLASRFSTVRAELQELCGLDTHHYNLKPLIQGFKDCLPWKLANHGYQTISIHGSTGLMYDRLYWYPRAGFEKSHFKETNDWQTQCYSFPGICDREIISNYLSHVFEDNKKRFVYYLTLNTHPLYDLRDLHKDIFNCAVYKIPEKSETCRMVKLHTQFFDDLAQILDKDTMAGVEVIIIGDHQPRIFDSKEFQKYLEDDRVSWMHFRIKDQSKDKFQI
ncbi:sulfatase-like hydrolase/transferase [Candidatus Nitrosacidococcus sp. I8]|uniref:sulfatase-like hydrolase/transferase n=1 Tax=Candidatus Nitrosacidococcus sp. I8 TaxID=2942908 RepID=UPI0022262166|nr:sulfatase-like hydrolase/transferase [Candidatus Nitrosacidococcus sp. I8]CAH9017117.1 hypothetical protein NURINAE_00305 [Candidatus Nitrosacidococcus sp. I8]